MRTLTALFITYTRPAPGRSVMFYAGARSRSGPGKEDAGRPIGFRSLDARKTLVRRSRLCVVTLSFPVWFGVREVESNGILYGVSSLERLYPTVTIRSARGDRQPSDVRLKRGFAEPDRDQNIARKTFELGL